jgi:hypothetical protein
MSRLLAATLPLALALAAPLAAAPAPDLRTQAERSGFQDTGRYDEVVQLCAAFQARWPTAVRCQEFGRTPQGRPMQVLVASTSGALDATAAGTRGLPVVLVQGGIHAGEIDGKDAGFLLLRELLEGRKGRLPGGGGVLDRQVLLFVPVFNVDGHERFRAWNRPNQRGPREMGFRVTARNLNLNRDYVKAESPEMQAMLRLVGEWDPVASVDLHVTDGAKFRHDVAVQVEPVNSGDEALRTAGRAFREAVISDLRARGSDPLPYYPSFVVDDDPASGIADGVATPRFSHGYFQLRNRFGMLVETHSWKDYPTRVAITHDTVLSVLRQVAFHGAAWRALEREADSRARDLGGTPVALAYKATQRSRLVDFHGYAYSRTRSDVSGALMTRYDETRPADWRIPLFDEVQPSVSEVAPRGGYLVPPEFVALVQPALRVHGIEYRVLGAPVEARFEAYRASAAVLEPASIEGHQRVKTLAGAWQPEEARLEAGALYVPLAQPKARLVMALLEPAAPDSLFAWGEFNNFLERKEYMEPYVAEEEARKMLASDAALAQDFARRLREDADFAASAEARLDYFYRRHPAFDERSNRYPVLRTQAAPAP